jgi:hypothetical protein
LPDVVGVVDCIVTMAMTLIHTIFR